MTTQKNKYIKIFISKTEMKKIFLEVFTSAKHSEPVRKTYLQWRISRQLALFVFFLFWWLTGSTQRRDQIWNYQHKLPDVSQLNSSKYNYYSHEQE